jgi:hypothetical protein
MHAYDLAVLKAQSPDPGCHSAFAKSGKSILLIFSSCTYAMSAVASSSRHDSPNSQALDVMNDPPILRLPPELFETLLEHVDPEDLQSTALALSRVFPDHPISKTHLWRHVVARSKGQMMPMWRKMKEMRGRGREGGPEATRTFSMVSHDPQADRSHELMYAGDLERRC